MLDPHIWSRRCGRWLVLIRLRLLDRIDWNALAEGKRVWGSKNPFQFRFDSVGMVAIRNF